MAIVLRNLLSTYDYNLVALPKTDIVPLQLLYKLDEGVGPVNSLIYNIFPPGEVQNPDIIQDAGATDIVGNALITFDATAGVTVLDKLLSALKMGKASANIAVSTDNEVTISYENVLESKVDLLSLDAFISGTSPNVEKFNTFREKLENSELYVISSILKSNAFSVTVSDKNGQKVDVQASLKSIVNANIDVTHNKDNSITLKNPGGLPVIFAFKAQQIIYDKKKWWQFFRSEEVKFSISNLKDEVFRGEGDYPTIPLYMGDELVEL